MSRHIISSTDGQNLHFETTEEYEEYKKDELELFLKHFNKLKERYGIYATNQGKYVESVDDLNDWDSKRWIENE